MFVSPAIFALVSLFIAALSSAATAFIGLGKGSQKLDELSASLKGLDTKIEALSANVQKHNGDLMVLENERKSLEKRLDKVEGKIEAFEKESARQHNESLKERQELREEVGRLRGSQESGERVVAEVRRSMDYLRDEGMKNVASMLAQIASGANKHASRSGT